MKEKNSVRKYDKYLNLESFNNFDVIQCIAILKTGQVTLQISLNRGHYD